MEFKEKHLNKTIVIGESRRYYTAEETHKEIPVFWEEMNNTGKNNKLLNQSNQYFQGFLGVCFPKKPGLDYMIAVSSDHEDEEWNTGVIPSGKYLMFEAIGPVPNELQKVTRDALEMVNDSSEYELRMAPQFEYYPSGDVTSSDYITEIWIPIK